MFTAPVDSLHHVEVSASAGVFSVSKIGGEYRADPRHCAEKNCVTGGVDAAYRLSLNHCSSTSACFELGPNIALRVLSSGTFAPEVGAAMRVRTAGIDDPPRASSLVLFGELGLAYVHGSAANGGLVQLRVGAFDGPGGWMFGAAAAVGGGSAESVAQRTDVFIATARLEAGYRFSL